MQVQEQAMVEQRSILSNIQQDIDKSTIISGGKVVGNYNFSSNETSIKIVVPKAPTNEQMAVRTYKSENISKNKSKMKEDNYDITQIEDIKVKDVEKEEKEKYDDKELLIKSSTIEKDFYTCIQSGPIRSKKEDQTDYPHLAGKVPVKEKKVKMVEIKYEDINREKWCCSSGYHLEQPHNLSGVNQLIIQGATQPALIKPMKGWMNFADGYSGYMREKYLYTNYNKQNMGQ